MSELGLQEVLIIGAVLAVMIGMVVGVVVLVVSIARRHGVIPKRSDHAGKSDAEPRDG